MEGRSARQGKKQERTRDSKVVAESATAEDDLLARALGLEDRGVGVDLRRAHRRYERARRREGGVEDLPARRLRAVGVEAGRTVACRHSLDSL